MTRAALVLVSVAGAWWFASCLVDDCSMLTNLATGGIMTGFLVAAIGAEMQSRRITGVGFAVAALTPLGFTVIEVGAAIVVASGAWLLMVGTATAAVGLLGSAGPARAARSVRIGLALAGFGTGIWGVEKLFSPELGIVPYLLAPIGLLVAAYSWRASRWDVAEPMAEPVGHAP